MVVVYLVLWLLRVLEVVILLNYLRTARALMVLDEKYMMDKEYKNPKRNEVHDNGSQRFLGRSTLWALVSVEWVELEVENGEK